jgi:TetR/AcrR family transcriptional regulator, transcriptional repressor of bet genes
MTRKGGTERREDMIAATVAMILEKGPAAATTRDVTNALGVGVGLLSHYFAWTELRALAFERVVRADLAATLTDRAGESAGNILDALIMNAFAERSDAVWRVWIEATDLASGDPRLAASVISGWALWREALTALFSRGDRDGNWACPDPDGAGWRILALLDGLAGLVLTQGIGLSREAATGHLAVALSHECQR